MSYAKVTKLRAMSAKEQQERFMKITEENPIFAQLVISLLLMLYDFIQSYFRTEAGERIGFWKALGNAFKEDFRKSLQTIKDELYKVMGYF